jgi:zinc protease
VGERVGPVVKHVLPNGLKVLTKEIHYAPIITFWVWYRVGSRNEIPGITGVSHWVEHMMFKGTSKYGKGVLDRIISENGGVWNAFTWIDYTAYFSTLPRERLALPIEMEADRMVNSLFDPNEVASERTVIISEREGRENYPEALLYEEVHAAAFKVHPYHHPVIGWKTDLQSMTREDLYHHYRSFYAPNNAVAVLVGDFDMSTAMGLIEQHFGPIQAQASPPPVRAVEPPQEGERRVTLRRPGPTAYFQCAYHTPPASHPDTYPLLLLDAVLSGAKPLGQGGRAMGRSARLYRALVDTQLAASASSHFSLTRDPYLFELYITLRPGVPIDKAEQACFDVITQVQLDGLTDEEFEKAKRQYRAQFVYASEGVQNYARWLGSMEMVHTYKAYELFLENLSAVGKEDVQRVAQQYLTETNRTVGWFIPVPAAAA